MQLKKLFQDCDPDPAFFLKADPDPDSGSQTNADPCGIGAWSPGRTYKSPKNEFFTTKKKHLKVSVVEPEQ